MKIHETKSKLKLFDLYTVLEVITFVDINLFQ